jgi:hypothetical protein
MHISAGSRYGTVPVGTFGLEKVPRYIRLRKVVVGRFIRQKREPLFIRSGKASDVVVEEKKPQKRPFLNAGPPPATLTDTRRPGMPRMLFGCFGYADLSST